MKKPGKTAYSIAAYLAILSIWQISSQMGLLNQHILPAPLKVMATFTSMIYSGKLLIDVQASISRVLIGFTLATLVAIPIGLVLGTNKSLKQLFSPALTFIRPIPPIAWIPIAIMWFGIGNTPSYLITMIAAFFPIFVNTLSGVENVSKEHMNVARCFGVGDRMIIRHIVLPSSMPFILSGMRIGLGIAWMSVVAAEMISAYSGLGYMLTLAQEMLQADKVLVGMMTIGLLGLILDGIMVRLQRRIIKWS